MGLFGADARGARSAQSHTHLVALADTSAWAIRATSEELRDGFEARVNAGAIATCDTVRMELLWSTRTHAKFVELRDTLGQLRSAPMGERVWRRATDVFELFAERGPLHHRQVGLPDLLIAAAAELAELPILHYDSDFEAIAEITGQPVEALAPLGSL